MAKKMLIKKTHIVFCIFLLLPLFGLLMETKDKYLSSNSDYSIKHPSTASFYNLTGTFMITNVTHYGDITSEERYKTIAGILIDDTLKNFTWSETAAAYPWCYGSGTKLDPYIIEWVYIDGQYIGKNYLYYSNILIRHSRVHFIIKNCSLHKSGVYADWNAGIFLYNTTNGQLLYNNFTYNRDSIQLFESHNNTISFNSMLSNHDGELVGFGAGIVLEGYGNGMGSCDNFVTNNTIINHNQGIVVFQSVNESISNNFIKDTLYGYFPEGGIYLRDTNYSDVTFNVFAGDYADFPNPYGDNIIDEQNCVGNVISGNFGNYSSFFTNELFTAQESNTWFYLENSNYNYIYGNRLLKSNPITQPTIPGYIIYITFIIELMSLIVISTILKKKSTFTIEK